MFNHVWLDAVLLQWSGRNFLCQFNTSAQSNECKCFVSVVYGERGYMHCAVLLGMFCKSQYVSTGF